MKKNKGCEQGCCTYKKRKLHIGESILLIIFSLVITFVLVKIDVISYFAGIDTSASLWSMVVLGLLASISTCLAVTGGVVIAVTDFVDKSSTIGGHMKFHSIFHLGRLIGFAIFGAILGGIGKFISISLGFTTWLSILLACMFIYLGGYLLGLFPSLAYSTNGIQKYITSKIGNKNIKTLPFSIGIATFFLPCGFTQSVQVMALASGSAMMGGLMMLFFAVGTIPGLALLGAGTSYAKDHRKMGFEKAVAVLLLVFGMFTLWGNASILGIQNKIVNTFDRSNSVAHIDNETIEYIQLSHNGYSLVPEQTKLQAGRSYEITILPEENGLGCMSSILLPGIDNTSYSIKSGVPITYKVTNIQPGQYSFVCSSMGMKQGMLIIEESV